MKSKQNLRQHYLDLLRAQPEETRKKKSQDVTQRLIGRPEYQRAKTIFTYIANNHEVDTAFLVRQALAMGKSIAVSLLDGDTIIPKRIADLDHLTRGPFGIMQPETTAKTANSSDLDLVIVPGLAFTRDGVRLGRGGGHFDRWLASLPSGIPTIGLAFDFQIAKGLPREEHDIAVSSVITN